jgi:hypothetical protein
MAKQLPEALSEFAESARNDNQVQKKQKKPLEADEHTKPKAEDNAAKHDAATRVLNEGATGEDRDADEAVKDLPDRIIESR